jgi:hypothetical protein
MDVKLLLLVERRAKTLVHVSDLFTHSDWLMNIVKGGYKTVLLQ